MRDMKNNCYDKLERYSSKHAWFREGADEQIVWARKPSSWLNFPYYLINIVLMLIIIKAMGFMISSPIYKMLDIVLMQNFTPYTLIDKLVSISGFLILAFLLFHCVYYFVWLRLTKYELTKERLFLTKISFSGIRRDQIELYRVMDSIVKRPFYLLPFGLGNIKIISTDKTVGAILLRGVKGPEQLADMIREKVQDTRGRRGIREFMSN
jgi:hypothetical protein